MRFLLFVIPIFLLAQEPSSSEISSSTPQVPQDSAPDISASTPQEVLEEPSPPVCYFLPPQNWEIAQPKHLSAHVQVGFIGKGSTDFRPSINLAFEQVDDVTMKEYLKAVKELHLAQPNTKWRDLGKFPTQAGEGRLTEISTGSPWGEVKMLQGIVIKEGTAYILTSAVLKPDLQKFQADILKSFRSLSLAPDFFSPIKDDQKRLELKGLFTSLGHFIGDEELAAEQKKQWELLQKKLSEDAAYMGSHWHYLVLKEGYAKIYSSASSEESKKSSP